MAENILPVDPLEFTDRKKYSDRLAETQKKTRLTDAVKVATGKMNKLDLVVACMDFRFIGGSMGSVVGERLGLAIDTARKTNTPLMIISRSGGARMMESVLSLMQLAKTSAKLAQLSEAGVPYISLMTDPTTGGGNGQLCHAGRFQPGRAGCPHRLCRSAGHSTDHRSGTFPRVFRRLNTCWSTGSWISSYHVPSSSAG